MRKVFLFFLFFSFISPVIFSQDTTFITTYYLGTDSVQTHTSCFSTCDSGIVFIQLHEDETTGIEAAKEYFMEYGGFLVQLKHSGERLLKFQIKNLEYTVDPNRIYTRDGLKNNLIKLKSYKPEPVMHLARLAKQMLTSYIVNKKLVVALHNNTENKFSILSYKKGMSEAVNAAKVFINNEMDPDDFILTTDTSIYRRIMEKNINVVLQSKKAKDDGSLSVYAQLNKIPYINIEAQHGHIKEQGEMLFAIKDIIAGYYDIIELNYLDNNK